tara:strand:- start:688 stop:1320 length:633 start_codon:yes stop_codon:yes gene_type:complete
MTIAEMHSTIDLLLDKADAPWFNPTEKDNYLNLAQIEFVETRYTQFEAIEKRREELLPLVKKVTYTGVNIINLTSISEFLYVLSLQAYITDSCVPTGTRIEPIHPIQLDDFAGAERDPWNKTTDENIGYTQYNDGAGNNTLEVHSTNVPSSVDMFYLKRPVDVSITVPTNSELPVSTHEEIVNIAVRKMMMTIQDQNYQVQMNEIQQQGQ